jgi:hypothetical protein
VVHCVYPEVNFGCPNGRFPRKPPGCNQSLL